VETTKPRKERFETAATVYFPMQHTTAILRAARSGTRLLAADLYDGSEGGQKHYATSALIGQPFAPGEREASAVIGKASAAALDGLSSWPVSIGYFSPASAASEKKDDIPLYEISYRLHDNGVSSELLLDYGTYKLRGELRTLVFLDPGTCRTPAQ
jgi:hypothetical protein